MALEVRISFLKTSVRMKLTFPKVGTWSLPGLLKIQSLIAGVKKPSSLYRWKVLEV
jgi:hypothetical protein